MFESVDLFGEKIKPAVDGILKRRFLFPPFTVLNARDGDWQERKRAWLLLGIRSEIGRGVDLQKTGANSAYGGNGFAGKRGPVANATPGEQATPAMDYSQRQRGAGNGRPLDLVHEAPPDGALEGYRKSETAQGLTFGGFSAEFGARGTSADASSTSVFDPVLCELMYRWFSPANGIVLDPFAGGSVRGVVASCLGRRYHGIDLSDRQISANKEQFDLCEGPAPVWVAGDSIDASALLPRLRANLLFSCPPYADLERYSDDPRDLSTMDYPIFRGIYSQIIAECAAMLLPDSFACFVVGDVRGKDGLYYGLPHDTCAAFSAAGMPLYNEAVLVTSVGSLPVRINAQFTKSRKLGKTHQNILVFVKGDPKRAAAKCEPLGQEFTGTATA